MTKPLAPKMPHHSDRKTPVGAALDDGHVDETSRRQMLHWTVAGALVLGSAPPARAQTVEQKVKEIVVATLGVSESEVTYEASFTDDLGADSLDSVELVMNIEDSFGVSIPDDYVVRMQTVGSLIYYFEDRQ